MRKIKKFSIWLSVSLGIILILIASAFFVASQMVQKESTKEKIHTLISKKVGGDVKYESMNLYFFHWPHVLIKNAEISIPDKIEGSFDTVMVYPKILPLLFGNFELSTLRFYEPDIKINLPKRSVEPESEEKEAFSFDEHKDQVTNILEYLNSNWKGLNVRIEYGKFLFTHSGEDFLNFNNVNAVIEFPGNTLSYRIYGNSNISEQVFFKGWINTKSFDSQGNFNLSGFKPHMLLEYMVPKSDLISDSKINMDLNYTSHELKVLQGNLAVTNSKLTLSKGDEEFKISGREIDTDIYLDENKSVFTINNAEFAYPDIKASGKHVIDKNLKKINLNLSGTDINVESSRDAVLFVAGEDRIVNLIFNIVRGGTVPEITLEASGENFKDIWKIGNFEIKGSMIDGNIFVPVGDFNLTDVSGSAVIADGRLEGTNLRAKSGNSLGYDGTFIIGIDGPAGPLSLDIMVDSDAAEIPPIIKKFVHDEGFLYELDLISNLQGKASGKLKLGDSKKSPKASIHVSKLNITGDYERVPEPVNIKGDKFDFSDNTIEFEGLDMDIGKFSSPETTGSFHWKDEKFLKLGSKDTEVDLGILFPWLSSFEIIRPHLKYIKSVTGSAFFSSIDFAGPVSQFEEWKINALGNINTVNLNLDGLGSEMTISKAEIKSTSEEVSISPTTVDIKDSKMNVGAVLTDYLTDWLKFRMDFYGEMLADEAKLFSDYFNVPRHLNFNSPISISDSNLVVQKRPDSVSPAAGDSSVSNGSDSTKELDLNINVVAESLEWADPETTEEQENLKQEEQAQDNKTKSGRTSLNGKVLIKSDNFKFKGFNWDSINAEVALLGDKIDVNINEANLCGIATPGLLEVTSPTLKLEFEPFTEQENLANAIKCLFDKAGIITGEFNFGGSLFSDGDAVNVMNSLEGELQLTSSDGRVTKYGGMARFFSALNFGEVFRGNTIDYEDEGFPYEYILVSADIKDGKLIINEAAMDGPSLKIVCEGSIDLVEEKLDLQVLVIPVMAVDSVIEKIPILSTVLGEKFVSLPVKVTGSISDPKVVQLSTHTIGAGLLGIIKQTLNIPVTLVKPLDSGKKKEKAEAESSELSDKTSEE